MTSYKGRTLLTILILTCLCCALVNSRHRVKWGENGRPGKVPASINGLGVGGAGAGGLFSSAASSAKFSKAKNGKIQPFGPTIAP